MSASADIQTKTHTNVLSVPINAVTTRDKSSDSSSNKNKGEATNTANQAPDNGLDNGKTSTVSAADLDEVVFVLKPDGTVKKVKVKTDIQDINNIEISDGLKEGDEVITGPYGTVSKILKDGTAVTVVPKEKLFEVKKS